MLKHHLEVICIRAAEEYLLRVFDESQQVVFEGNFVTGWCCGEEVLTGISILRVTRLRDVASIEEPLTIN